MLMLDGLLGSMDSEGYTLGLSGHKGIEGTRAGDTGPLTVLYATVEALRWNVWIALFSPVWFELVGVGWM